MGAGITTGLTPGRLLRFCPKCLPILVPMSLTRASENRLLASYAMKTPISTRFYFLLSLQSLRKSPLNPILWLGCFSLPGFYPVHS